MKKKVTLRRLTLARETIRTLAGSQLTIAVGGDLIQDTSPQVTCVSKTIASNSNWPRCQ